MAGPNILVVEDQRAVAGALRMRLRGLGYDVMAIASDGREAIEKAGELRPDLILMDIRLGEGMDGIEAAHRIRAEYDIPVVYVSAYADRELLDRAKATHPAGFINKPFTTKDLLTTINLALDQAATAHANAVAEEALAASPRDAVLTTDLEGQVTFISRGAEELAGWSREKIVGRPLDGAIATLYGMSRDEAKSTIEEVLTRGKEHTLVRKGSGRRGSVTDILTPLRDAQGNHFGVALRFGPDTVNSSVASLKRAVDAFSFVLDQFPIGVVLVDRNLKVLHANAQSGRIIDDNPGMLSMRGHLMAVDDSQHAELHAMIRRAADRGESRGASTSELLCLPDSEGERGITIVATPVQPDEGGDDKPEHRGEPIQIALFLFDPLGNRFLSAPALRQLFGLTRSEAKLVQSIAGGCSLEDGAKSLGISVNTARTHLKHIFHKTGAKRQSELIHQVENSAAALPFEYEKSDPPPRPH